ncbi:MAG: methyltransferase domain-containing protein [Chitinophagaceae bacterium]
MLRRIGAKLLFKTAGRFNRQLLPHPQFAIKKGYHHAASAEAFDDTINTDEWQRPVYELAASLAKQQLQPVVIDIGCGSAFKLMQLLGQYDSIGIEIEPTYTWLKRTYPTRKWKLFSETDPATLHADLVICSDIIEHLRNPDELMRFLSQMSFHRAVISTPERDAVAGVGDYGPPGNTTHYREWSKDEFRNYVQAWFDVIEQHIFSDKSITQIVICQKKQFK